MLMTMKPLLQQFGIYSYPFIVHFAPEKREFDSIFNQHRTKDVMSAWIERICGEEKIKEEVEIQI